MLIHSDHVCGIVMLIIRAKMGRIIQICNFLKSQKLDFVWILWSVWAQEYSYILSTYLTSKNW